MMKRIVLMATLAAMMAVAGSASAAAGGPASCMGHESSSISPPGSSEEFPGGRPDLELPPIGSACECETGTDAPSSGEFSRLPDEGVDPCPRSHHTSSNPSGNSS